MDLRIRNRAHRVDEAHESPRIGAIARLVGGVPKVAWVTCLRKGVATPKILQPPEQLVAL